MPPRSVAFLFAFAYAGVAAAQPELAKDFVYVPGKSGAVGCTAPGLVNEAVLSLTTEVLDDVGLDPDFAVILTADVLVCASIFYVPVKNDVRGIGYQRVSDPEIFDDAPGRRLQGIAFLNDLPYWLEEPEELETAFLHEIGHRWLARVHAQIDGEDIDLTGRDDEHWSYYLDNGASPLEGNAWSSDDPPIADSPPFPVRYSPLDLYLMGAYGADEVPAFRLLEPEASEQPNPLDCDNRPLSRSSPPQRCGALTVPGHWRPVTVDDVIAAEGPREPARSESPDAFTVAFLLLDPGGADFDVEHCEALSASAAHLVELFGEATDGRLRLENAISEGSSCEELPLEPTPGAGCGFTSPGPPPFGSARFRPWLVIMFGLFALARAGRRRFPGKRRLRPG